MPTTRRTLLTGTVLAALATLIGAAVRTPASFADSGDPAGEAVVAGGGEGALASNAALPGDAESHAVEQAPQIPTGAGPAPAQIPSSPASRGAPIPPPLPQGPWQWQQTAQADGTVVASAAPDRYTVAFLTDGRLSFQADCNRGTGSYEQQGASLTLRLGATTLAACAPGSQDRVFTQQLGAVQGYRLDGPSLLLALRDGGTMAFGPASTGSGAPAPIASPSPSTASATTARVTGTVTYRERIALPPSAVVQVSLQDVSRADAPATILGEQTIETAGRQVPIPFEIAYDPAAIDPRFRYAVRARITVDGQLMFTSTVANLVITSGNPSSDVEIVMQRV
jgi:uncharacterized lipoprotein YbaY